MSALPEPIDHTSFQEKLGSGGPGGEPPNRAATPIKVPAASSGYLELRIWAESFEDIQRARISCTNRMQRGGVPPDAFAGQLETLMISERSVGLAMRRTYRRTIAPSVRAWQQSTFGIGEHLLARLLGVLGDPRHATPYHWEGDGADRILVADEPYERGVRQLYSYCGHGDATRKRAKGMTAQDAFALGSPRCKMLVHLLAEASIKCRVAPIPPTTAISASAGPTTSPDQPNDLANPGVRPAGPGISPTPSSNTKARGKSGSDADQPIVQSKAIGTTADRRYRATYDQRRAHTATTHPEWTDGHSHNDALRIVGKHILADLWEAASA